MREEWDQPSPEQLERAITAAREAMPAYAGLLTFYARVFQAQAADVDSIRVAAALPDASRAEIARKEGFPLLAPAELPVDLVHGGDLLVRLCRAVQDVTPPLAAAAAAIQAGIAEGRLNPETLPATRLQEGAARFEALAAELKTPVEVLAFFADQSLMPSREAGRRQITAAWEDEVRTMGFCPVCGGAPALGSIEEDGRRYLFCSVCRHRWQVPRVRCAVCGQTDAQKLYYIYSEEEPAYRIDACEACRHYVKTVDRRRLTRPFYPPLEQVLTVHLDLVAAEKDLVPAPGANWPA